MILFKEFEASDLDFETIEDLDENWTPEFAKAVEDSKLAVTAVVDNKVVACGGVHPVDDFSGEIWIRLSHWCVDHPVRIIRWLRSGFDVVEEKYPFKQINAHVKEGFCESEKLLRFLGFTDIGTEDGFTIFAKRVQE